MLLGENRRRDEHHHLPAVGDRLVGRAQRDLGLAIADVAADQPVHRPGALHVGLHRLDRLELVGRLPVREGTLQLQLPFAVRRELVAAAGAALRIEVEQLAGELAGGATGTGLDALPPLGAERRELRRLAAGADVPRDLRELIGRREDAVGAPVLELQVVAGDSAHGLRLEAGEAGDPVILVDHVVADPQVGERGQSPAGGRRGSRAGAMDQSPERDDGELEVGRDEPVGKRRLREEQCPPGGCLGAVEEGGLQAIEVVARPLGLAAVLERDDDPVARSQLALELLLGLADAARRRARRLGAKREPSARVGVGDPDGRALAQGGGNVDIQAPRIARVHGRGRVLPVVVQRRLHLPLGGDEHGCLRRDHLERRAKALEREKLREIGSVSSASASASSASSRYSAPSSAAGASSSASASPSDRWVKVENHRICSISSPNSSRRAARSSVAPKTSRMPPRIANCPRSVTWSARS